MKKTYTVLSAIRCDGTDYSAGDTIDLSQKDAISLIAAGAIDATPVKPVK